MNLGDQLEHLLKGKIVMRKRPRGMVQELFVEMFLCKCQFSLTLLQKLESLNQFPDFNSYLIFVLTKLKGDGIGKLPLFHCLETVSDCMSMRM